MSNDGQFGIPSLVVVLVITGLVWKYLWPSGSSSAPGGQARDSLSQMRQREVAVERIQQMFPQVDRRTILWDLQRNGGSIAATTEKILSGTIQLVSCTPTAFPDFLLLLLLSPPSQKRSCKLTFYLGGKKPPITFQPPPPPGSAAASSGPQSSSASSAKPGEKPAQPNLIQRYNLQDKVQQQSEEESAAAAKKWSTNKDERQTLLQKRRDEMILAARRKMEAKIAAEKAAAGSS